MEFMSNRVPGKLYSLERTGENWKRQWRDYRPVSIRCSMTFRASPSTSKSELFLLVSKYKQFLSYIEGEALNYSV